MLYQVRQELVIRLLFSFAQERHWLNLFGIETLLKFLTMILGINMGCVGCSLTYGTSTK
jgi:hypothetical protein